MREPERTAKQNVNICVPPPKEEIAEAVFFSPQERLQEHIVRVGTKVPVDKGEIAAIVPTTQRERGPERIASQIVDAPVPPDKGEIAEIVLIKSNERDQNFCVEQVTDFLVPLMKKEIAKALHALPQEHIHESVAERIFNDLVPHFKKGLVEVLQGLFQEHSQEFVVEHMGSFLFDKLWPLVKGSFAFAEA